MKKIVILIATILITTSTYGIDIAPIKTSLSKFPSFAVHVNAPNIIAKTLSASTIYNNEASIRNLSSNDIYVFGKLVLHNGEISAPNIHIKNQLHVGNKNASNSKATIHGELEVTGDIKSKSLTAINNKIAALEKKVKIQNDTIENLERLLVMALKQISSSK